MTGHAVDAAALRRVVGVTPVDDRHAVGDTSGTGTHHGGLFGGQMISQCLAAVEHTVPDAAVPDSIHVGLLGPGRAGEPLDFEITEIRSGRALQHRGVRATQHGTLIAEATVVSTTPADGVDWQRLPRPAIAEPDVELPSLFGDGLGRGLFEAAHPTGTDPADPPSHPLWVRSLVGVPDDPWLTAAALAYWSDFGMNWITRSTHHALSEEDIGSLSATHVLWLHRRASIDRWHLLDVACETISGNHGFVSGTLHDDTGERVATLDQRVFIRRPSA